jgi:hypothetical protein
LKEGSHLVKMAATMSEMTATIHDMDSREHCKEELFWDIFKGIVYKISGGRALKNRLMVYINAICILGDGILATPVYAKFYVLCKSSDVCSGDCVTRLFFVSGFQYIKGAYLIPLVLLKLT